MVENELTLTVQVNLAPLVDNLTLWHMLNLILEVKIASMGATVVEGIHGALVKDASDNT